MRAGSRAGSAGQNDSPFLPRAILAPAGVRRHISAAVEKRPGSISGYRIPPLLAMTCLYQSAESFRVRLPVA